MRTMKIWVVVALLLVCGLALFSAGQTVGVAQERGLNNHWRYHDGHWNYWNSADKHWYYTDGAHWFQYDTNAWRPYTFDGQFGRTDFERGNYVVPGAGVNITLPRHRIWVK